MDAPRILLIGHTGQVGWELRRTLAPLGALVAVDYPEVDLADGASLQRCVQDARPQVIVNAAAYTAVDQAESDPDKAMQINGTAPGLLAEAARKTGALLLHYSTDYVFDGTKGAPYDEADPSRPQSVYGRTKLAGEQAVRAVGGAHLIFRLCWVYGARGRNFMLTMLRLAREREQLRVVGDQVGGPTWCRLIAEATAVALHQVLAAPEPGQFHGLYHLSAAGATSWHGFAEAIVALMPPGQNQCRRVEAITTAEYPTPARRPAYSVLACGKFKRAFGLQLPDWHASLKLVLEPSP